VIDRMTGGSAVMRASAWYVGLVLAAGVVTLTVPSIDASAESLERTVRGTVLAVSLIVDPQTIVVNVTLPNKDKLIVGARVPAETQITRGTRVIRLADVKVGESADVTYLKASDGLIARSIHVR
jgi:hypothetical protein